MEFGNLRFLYFVLIPILVFLFTFIGLKKKFKIMELLRLAARKKIEITKMILFILGTLSLFIALLSPQKLISQKNIEIKGLDVYILFDTSNSMLAEDVFPSRLERGKTAVENLVNNLTGDRVGIIPYSDSAYIQLPLTDDYAMARNYIKNIDNNSTSGGGTDLYSALLLASKSFEETTSKNKIVLIVSDGGDSDEKVRSFLKNNDLKVYGVGVGTKDGSTIPAYNANNQKNGFVKDEKGKTVISSLNSKFLSEISKAGYFEINNLSDNSLEIAKNLINYEKNVTRKESGKIYKKLFQYPLLVGLIFILLGLFLRGGIRNEKKN